MDERRKKQLLGSLLVLLAIAVFYRLQNPFEQKRVDRLKYTSDKSNRADEANSESSGKDASPVSPKVMVELLVEPPQQSGNVHRDIFALPGLAAAPKPKPKPPKPKQPKVPPKPSAPDPVQQINQELSLFRVFGFLDDGHNKALFLERGKEILVVRAGDRIDGKYLVEKITQQSITLRTDALQEAVHIDLGEL